MSIHNKSATSVFQSYTAIGVHSFDCPVFV